ncbi:putative Acyl-CoA N-acyltransferase [Vibrio nigripulchritudo MADA3029]|uniref:GNAT family N-acetyltransferase n=1 Tax=Vibrio nigripulchritudo TaxID=28173 RepID=UPI0003B19A7A|nr:GNAT family N-acetyltransferase [Vibrio nigripulchritudo]KJY74719.1 GCN5 family acetyltransferase [Vibrio nigripulchritudo]CCN47538.1 putative Acyl-CoA N-acyltransferase [Vibrio nigripulchritudo MADA3020]CCN55946.1 putative Acyl-CoA N-acyltransferase [Vibrio nigripulchritudo MADA3021]CCN57168.1 putative Acyl-CoA N-acyltransferase [Vibrio nigripulchritudo MADA3029]
MPTIRPALHSDIKRISDIESLCFPESEAASLESFTKRFDVFPECFFVLEVDNQVVGHINGCRYHLPELPDELFEDANLHNPEGAFQTVFGLAVDPQHQRKGYASELTKHLIQICRQRELEGMVLTCKEHLIPFYQHHGFVLRGKSESCHGGASWFDMTLNF